MTHARTRTHGGTSLATPPTSGKTNASSHTGRTASSSAHATPSPETHPTLGRPVSRIHRLKKLKESRYVYASANAYRFYLEGQLHAQNQRHTQAIHAYQSALVYTPNSAYLHYCIAKQYMQIKRWDTAFLWAQKMLSLHKTNAQAYHLLGQLYVQRRQQAQAVTHFLQAIHFQPTLIEPYLDLYQLWEKDYTQRKRLNTLLQQAIQKIPDRYELPLRLGILYERLEKHDEAIQMYQTALNTEPSQATALVRLSGMLFRLRRWNDAIKIYLLLLDYRPDAWQFRLLLASTYRLRQHPHDQELAAFQIRYVMKESAEHEQVERAFRVGWEYQARGQLLSARRWFLRCLTTQPRYAPALLALGGIAMTQGQWATAIRWLQQIQTTDKDAYLDARSRLIEVYWLSQQPTQARKILDETRRMLGTQIKLWIRLSQAWVERASAPELKREARYLQQALRKQPQDVMLRFQLAYVAFKLRAFDRGQSLLKQIIREQPNHASALNFLGYLYAVQGTQLKQAEAHVQRALFLDPGNGYYLDSLAWIWFRQGKVQPALALLKQIRHLLPLEPAVYFHLAKIHQHLKQNQRALQLYRQTRALFPPPEIQRQVDQQIKRLSQPPETRPKPGS